VTSAAERDCSSSRRTPEPPGGAGAPAFASRSFRRALAWRAAGSRECAESERRRGGGVERAGDIDRASAPCTGKGVVASAERRSATSPATRRAKSRRSEWRASWCQWLTTFVQRSEMAVAVMKSQVRHVK